jgi:hypothetical protein
MDQISQKGRENGLYSRARKTSLAEAQVVYLAS